MTSLGPQHHRIVIVGGGTAGIITAQLLQRAGQQDIALIEPSPAHFYQPLWTLVGAGAARIEASARPEARFIPPSVRWLHDSVAELDPARQRLTTASGLRVGYDFLVLAPGIELDWQRIPGLLEAVNYGHASTNYAYDLAPQTWRLIRDCRHGIALFHMPATPIKCPGAPQKIMYLAADYFRRRGRQVHVLYGCATPTIFGARRYAAVLEQVLARYEIDARFNHELIEVRPDRNEAIFRRKGADAELGDRVTVPYAMLHVVPPQRAPAFIRESPLADPKAPREGWVKVHPNTLQTPDYPNVFALGDVAGTPNSKTGAAALHQAHVVAANLLALQQDRPPAMGYNGYIACPIVTGYGRMLLCELDYSGAPAPSLPFLNTFRERRDMWLLKKYGLPWLYWHVLLRGGLPPLMHKVEGVPLEALAAADTQARGVAS